MDAGLLIARTVFGLLMMAHGCQKLFGWFGGPGMTGTAAFLEGLGFRPGRRFAVANVVAECAGGLLLALGLFEPAAAAAIVSIMTVAIVTVHWGNGLLAPHGVELPLLYLAAASCLALTGPGTYSVDAVLGLTNQWTMRGTSLLLVAAVGAGLASLAVRRRVLSAAAHA